MTSIVLYLSARLSGIYLANGSVRRERRGSK